MLRVCLYMRHGKTSDRSAERLLHLNVSICLRIAFEFNLSQGSGPDATHQRHREKAIGSQRSRLDKVSSYLKCSGVRDCLGLVRKVS
jgi:hypothetical protein